MMSGVTFRYLFRNIFGRALLLAVGAMACGGKLDGTRGSGDFGTGGSGSGGADAVVVRTGGSGGSIVGGTGGSGGTTGGSGGAITGTGGSTDLQPEPFWPDLSRSDFTPPVCDNGTYRMTVGLNPAYPADYIAFRVARAYQQFSDGASTYSDLLDQTGTDCSTAIYVTQCLTQIGMTEMTFTLNESCGGPPYPCQHYLVWNQGDSHTFSIGPADIAKFLGPIDTPQEAMLLAYQGTFGGYWISCDGQSGARAVADGYEVLVTQMVSDCPVVVDRVLLHVGTDGTITELRRNVLSAGGGCI